MRDEWAERFAERARAYWTPARTEDLVRDKTLAVLPAEAPELLRALGLLHRDASMPGAERRKFFQINHMVAMLGPAMRELVATREASGSTEPLRLVDAGCGRSYLTLLLAHAIPRLHGVPVQVLGVDRNAEVIDESRRRTNAALLGDHVKHHVSRLDAIDVRRA
ncbi:MAG: methyltransferase, partial [Myxococcales bacterium]|nr:methyltransferase [Myxococcales bacterium]